MKPCDWMLVERVKQKAEDVRVTITVKQDGFALEHEKKSLGVLPTVEDVYSFLCGLDWGIGIGFVQGVEQTQGEGM